MSGCPSHSDKPLPTPCARLTRAVLQLGCAPLSDERRRGSQVVRQRFAKPLYVGSSPILASDGT